MNYIFNNAEDIAESLSEAFTKVPNEPDLKQDQDQGLREFGIDGILVGDSPLRIIGAWNSTSALMRQARKKGLLNDQIENGLVLYAQQSVCISKEDRARTAKTEELIDDKKFRFYNHSVSSESEYSDDSDQDLMVQKYMKSTRPYSRTKITETGLRLAAAEQANKKDLANVLRTSLNHMMTVNGQADPDRFHRDCLSSDKYLLRYSRGPNIDKLLMFNNTPIRENSLQEDNILIGEHFSEYLNGQWIADAVSKEIPFLYASIISPDELEVILNLKTESGPDTSLIEMLEQFGCEISYTETYRLVNEHYEEHQGTPIANYTSHISGIFKPDGKGDINLTATGKEIFYLLELDYLPCIVEGRLFFSPNGDASLVEDRISTMRSHPLWNRIPLIIDLLPRVVDNVINAITESVTDTITEVIVNKTINTQYKKTKSHYKSHDIDTDEDSESDQFGHKIKYNIGHPL